VLPTRLGTVKCLKKSSPKDHTLARKYRYTARMNLGTPISIFWTEERQYLKYASLFELHHKLRSPSSIAINTVHTDIIASTSCTNLHRCWIELQAPCRGNRSKLAVVRVENEADRANSSAHQMKITPYPVIFNKPAGQLAYFEKI